MKGGTGTMPAIDLNKAYDEIKAAYTHSGNTAKPLTYQQRSYADRNYSNSGPKWLAFRNKAVLESERLREECYRHLLLDIYMKILPFDDGYADGVRGQCKQDVDGFLADKKMTGEDYFKSAYAETKAPLLEYIIRSVGNIGKIYMETAKEIYDEASDAGVDIEPYSPAEEDVENMTVAIKGDMEYEDFVDRLKKKTIKKIVDDVSKLIVDKKSEAEMVFAPKENARITDSAFTVAFEYITESFIKAQVELPTNNDELIGLAIRESTLNVIDCVFEQQGKNIKHFARKVRLGNGVLVNKGLLNGGVLDAEYGNRRYTGDC